MNFSKLRLKRAAGQPLYNQLVKALEGDIEAGELKNGERLPSERDLAGQIKLSRTTVVNAYRELESRGLVRSYVGRGTFVCAKPEPSDAPFAWRGKVSAGVARLGNNLSIRHLTRDILNTNLISYGAGSPSLACFQKPTSERWSVSSGAAGMLLLGRRRKARASTLLH